MHTTPRLYEIFKPTHYDVTFHLDDIKSRHIHGTVHINGEQLAPEEIRLHAKDLEISNILVNDVACPFHLDGDTLIIKHAGTGIVDVSISYSLTMTDSMHGIYPCYFDVDGDKKELIATQFESHHAREAFPCVDEPEAKATFDVTIFSQPELTVLSNMPVQHQSTEKGILTTHFEDTPRMSPYLLAFVVGELQKKTAKTSGGTEVNIYATHAQTSKSLDFALDVSVRSIEFFNDYFGVPYPLPKCDHVALPDFSSGAMENWGLITYREICLLADESTSITTKQYAATVIAHELSHQWFGNLVTMKWWDDLWLNESFATLMEYVAVDALFPKWDIWMVFATNESLSALRRDYLPGIQAVKTAVNHPDEISTLFDPSIVYAKGARLLAMLREYVGDDVFQKALRSYFTTHAYKNTVGDDLWEAVSAEAGQDISAFMKPWLEQSGLPIVRVTSDGPHIGLSQERFTIPHDDSLPQSLWPIPILTNNHYHLFDTTHETLTAPLPLNSGNAVHAMYAYDKVALDAIIAKLVDKRLPAVDRLSFLHEVSLAARGGVQKTTDLLTILEAYLEETEEPVWDIISLVYGDLKRFVETDETAERQLKSRILSHASLLYETLGMTSRADESESTTKLRGTILGLLGYAEHEALIQDCLALFRDTPKIEALDAELRALVCSIAVKHGTSEDVTRVVDTHHSSQQAEVKQDMSVALCSTKDETLVSTLLDMLSDETKVRAQDVDRWFIFLMRNRYAREQAWHWMTSNWAWIEKTFKGDKSYDTYPRYAASALSTTEWLGKYKEFFTPLKKVTALSRAIALGEKDIESRSSWLERDGAAVLDALTR